MVNIFRKLFLSCALLTLAISCGSLAAAYNSVLISEEQKAGLYFYLDFGCSAFEISADELFASTAELVRNLDDIPFMRKQTEIICSDLKKVFIDVEERVSKSFDKIVVVRNNAFEFDKSVLISILDKSVEGSQNYAKAESSFLRAFDMYNLWVDGMSNIGHLPRHQLYNIEPSVKLADLVKAFLLEKYSVAINEAIMRVS